MSKFLDTVLNTASLFLLGKEILDNTTSCNRWKEMYDSLSEELQQAKQEARESREEVRTVHLQCLELLQMLQEVEASRSSIYRQYLTLVDSLGEMGITVSEAGEVVSDPEDEEPFEPDTN